MTRTGLEEEEARRCTPNTTQKETQQIDDAAPIGYYIEAQRMKAYSEIEKTRRATGALSNALRARCC